MNGCEIERTGPYIRNAFTLLETLLIYLLRTKRYTRIHDARALTSERARESSSQDRKSVYGMKVNIAKSLALKKKKKKITVNVRSNYKIKF